MAYQGKHTGATIDAQIGRVVDGSVVTDNTLHEITSDDTKPVTGAAVEKGILARTDSLVMKGSRNPVSGEAVAKELEDVARLVDGKLPIDNLHAPMLIFEVIWNMYNNDVPLQYSTPRAAEVARTMYDMQTSARGSLETTVMLVMSSPDIDIVYRVPLSYANGSWRGVVNDRLCTYKSAWLDGEENTQYIGLLCVEITLSVDTSGVVAMASKVSQIQVTSEAYRDEMQGPVYVKREQSFTEEEKAQARKNIGAASTTEYYPEMAVGTADNLRGRGEATEQMFTYRPSAGASNSIAEEGVATMRRIKGNTIVHNQLLRKWPSDIPETYEINGVTLSHNNDGRFGIRGTLTELTNVSWPSSRIAPKTIQGHVYAILTDRELPDGWRFGLSGATTTIQKRSHITTCNRPGNSGVYIYGFDSDQVVGRTYEFFFKPSIVDLTQMFGAGNEPATIEEYRALCPDDYLEYNEGVLRSVNVESIVTNGFNQFNGEYAEVLPNNTYYLGGGYASIGFAEELGGTTEEIVLAEDKLYTPSTKGYIYASGANININLSHSGVRDGEYEPYEERVHELPEIARYFPEGMRSAGSVYDEITESEVIQRVGVRAYEEGDDDNSEVMTDGINTVYPLAEPIVTPIPTRAINLNYAVWDWGTEKVVSSKLSAPFRADIVYGFNAVDTIRTNKIGIEALLARVVALEAKVAESEAEATAEPTEV